MCVHAAIIYTFTVLSYNLIMGDESFISYLHNYVKHKTSERKRKHCTFIPDMMWQIIFAIQTK